MTHYPQAGDLEGIKKTLICVYSIYVLVLVPYVLIRRRQKFFVCLQSSPYVAVI